MPIAHPQPLCVIQDVLNIFERFTILSFFCGNSLLAMMIVLGTVWIFVPKTQDHILKKFIDETRTRKVQGKTEMMFRVLRT